MVEPVSSEDIKNHPWLSSWNKVDDEVRIDILKTKTIELEDNLATASIIIILLFAVMAVALIIMLAVPVLSLSSDQASNLLSMAFSHTKK